MSSTRILLVHFFQFSQSVEFIIKILLLDTVFSWILPLHTLQHHRTTSHVYFSVKLIVDLSLQSFNHVRSVLSTSDIRQDSIKYAELNSVRFRFGDWMLKNACPMPMLMPMLSNVHSSLHVCKLLNQFIL